MRTLPDAPMDRELLLAHLLRRYAVEEATCRRNTEAFLAEAIARGMLIEHPPAA